MALESVDLLTVLRRAKKATADAAAAAPAPIVSESSGGLPADKPLPATARSEPEVTPVPLVKAHEREELAGLHDELYGDEVLIQRMLGLLYRSKKNNPHSGFISILDMEKTLRIEREGAAFVMSYMKTQKVIEMDDKSRMAITVPGINYLRSVLGLHVAGPSVSNDAGKTPQPE